MPSLRAGVDDDRTLLRCVDGKKFSSSVYRLLTFTGARCDVQASIWGSAAPPRVRLFGWLAAKDRIHSKANLVKKHIRDEDLCELCRGVAETTNHLLFGCPRVTHVWLALGVTEVPNYRSVWSCSPPLTAPQHHWATARLLLLWTIWNHRHDVVFRGKRPRIDRAVKAAAETLKLWSYRVKPDDRGSLLSWSPFLSALN